MPVWPQTAYFVDDETSKTVSFMRRNGLLKYKKGDLEIELSPEALKKPKVKVDPLTPAEVMAQEQAEARAAEYQAYLNDPEAIMFWSSGFVVPEDDHG